MGTETPEAEQTLGAASASSERTRALDFYLDTASRSVQVLVPWMRVHAPGAAPPQPRTITASACAAVVIVYSTSPAVLLGFQLIATASPSRHGTLCARTRFKARPTRKRREARARTCR